MYKTDIYDLKKEYKGMQSAVHELLYLIATVHVFGGGLIGIYHGGSDGDTRIKNVLRREMKKLKDDGRIKCILFGERFNDEDTVSRYLMDKFPGFSESEYKGAGNSDITFLLI